MDPVIVPILMGLAFVGMIIFSQSGEKPGTTDTPVDMLASAVVKKAEEAGLSDITITIGQPVMEYSLTHCMATVAAALTIITGFLRYSEWWRDKKKKEAQ